MPKAILFDASKCSGCRGCQVACKAWNEREATYTGNNGTYENPPTITSECWMRIKFNEEDKGTAAAPDIKWRFTKYQCMHCDNAACVDVCPAGATTKQKVSSDDADGYVVVTDPDKCIGCNYCVANCPFSACAYGEKEKGVFRCRLCLDRISNSADSFAFEHKADWSEALEGQFPRNIPACVKTCTTGALSYGERADMVAEAEQRVADLKAKGVKDAQTYGIKEVGGVGTLRYIYVLEDKPEAYGLPVNPKVPARVDIFNLLAKPMGSVAAGAAVVAVGLNYVINRRNAALEKKE